MLRKERLRAAGGLAVLGAMAALLVLVLRHAPAAAPSPPARAVPASAKPVPSSSSSASARPAARPAPADPGAAALLADRRDLRRVRLEQTLASYLDWAQYPPSSRPARERADRLRPHAVSPRTLPLVTADRDRTRARVILSQSHLYLAGDEGAALAVACERDGAPVPCAVRSAVATPDLSASGDGAAGAGTTAPAPAPLAFADDGLAPDRAAGDGVLTALFAPAEQGFAGYTGPVRVALEVDAGGEIGAATFALAYTSDVPATFTGTTREQLAGGSLQICVELRVREPGRYLLDARVDGADGETFAFVGFDRELAAGVAEACFEVFGKLVRDEEARAPFTLRDVEGFRLLEDAFPDRHTLPTWEGRVHTTKAYAPEDFTDSPWESDAKDRHAAGLRARAELASAP